MTVQIFTVNTSSIGTGVRAPLGTADSALIDFGGIVYSTDDTAIEGTGSDQIVNVQGMVMAATFAVHLGDAGGDSGNQLLVGESGYVGSFGSLAVWIQAKNSTVDNRGTIWGGPGQGVSIGGAPGTSHVLNSGTIGAFQTAIYHTSDVDMLVVENSGLIKSYGLAFVGSDGVDQITNTGRIIGAIQLDFGNDIYDGSAGRLTGAVFGSFGDDMLAGGIDNDQFFGEDNNDTLYGNGGNDELDGGVGADRMFGGTGNDFYHVDNPDDIVSESGGSGIDRVESTISFSLVNSAHVIGAVENLTLVGNSIKTVYGIGNALDNVIVGSVVANALSGGLGNDILNGVAGNDRLLGGLGNDALRGGLNADIFVFNTPLNASTNRDFIIDFSHADDTFQLASAVFTKLGAGVHALNPAFFHTGAAAADANDYIVYNKATGMLSYDADGNGAHAAIAFALLNQPPMLAADDFVVI